MTHAISSGKYCEHKIFIEEIEMAPVLPNRVTFAIFSALA